MPIAENFGVCPEIKIGAAIQLIQISKNKTVDTEQMKSLWEVFKIQKLTGSNFYESEDKVYSHFINWSKSHFDIVTIKPTSNGNTAGNNKKDRPGFGKL